MYTVIVLNSFSYEVIIKTSDLAKAEEIRDNLIEKFGSNAIIIDHDHIRTMSLIIGVVMLSMLTLAYMATW